MAHFRAETRNQERLLLRTALPISGAGKILKNALREPFWKGAKRQVS